MKKAMRLKLIPAAVLAMLGMGTASAAMVAAVCEVNGQNGCQSSAQEVPASSILVVRGYAFDLENGDMPQAGGGGFIVVRNEDTLSTYKLPIQSVEARPDVVAPLLTGEIAPENYDMVNAGFVAQVFLSSLPPGHYTVQQARVLMKKGGMTDLPIGTAGQRASFLIGSGQSPFSLVKPDGAEVPLSMGKASGGVIPAKGYPALRDGNYTIKVSMQGMAGAVTQSKGFVYKRPVLAVPVSVPIVQDFPGMTTRITPTNPLNNRALDVASLPTVVDELGGATLRINGATVEAGSSLDIPKQPNLPGIYPALVQDEGDTEQQLTTKLWVNLPDAPNIVLRTTRWDPSTKIQVSASKLTAAVKVEDLDVQAKLEGGSVDTCQSLTMIRPEYMLSQTAGVNCAIRFDDLPVGMKYNPYASNALRGSVASVGVNSLPYAPGVVYTNPATKKTAFYAAKTSGAKIDIEGVVPAPIELKFRNDRLLDEIYAKNTAQFPGKNFATVDPAQPRAMGIMNVKGAYRDIMTRVTYPGTDNVKEVFSSITESNVPLLHQVTEPWATYPVTVESWYAKAPEFKTVQTLEFIGVPLKPIVNLEKTFVSHDKADTIIRGQMGISRGQTLSFDAASMGVWQVFIREEKGESPLVAPVTVNSDGSFQINLGRLTAGTRYVVAEAKMITTEGLVSESSVVSKSRALITAVGDTIEASLTAKSLSGKAPFVQTISTKLTDPKQMRNLLSVKWERLKTDGSWERIMRNEAEQVGVNYTATVETAGTASYRAILVNKHSGVEFATDPITLQAFDLPTFQVKAPAVVQAKKPVTLEILADEGFDATYTWKILTTGGYEGDSEATGKTFTFTPVELKNFAIEVSGRAAGAPDAPGVDVKKTVGIKAVNPLAARASIGGPTYMEAGKPYAFKATINDVVPSTAGKAYTVKGYWQLPDGSTVEGTELSFTPRPGDNTLSFITYVDGYPEETTAAVHSFKTWNYVWPTAWRIKLVPSALDVPALIKYYVEAKDFDLKALNGEPLTYTWSFPPEISKTSGSDVAGAFSVSKHGAYQVAVQVADTRGNVVDVLSDEFTILPPASVKTQASIVSKYGAAYYAPGTYYISLKIQEIPRGDSFLRNEVLVNGNKVGEFTGSGNYVAFETPGAYDVKVRTITKAGNYGEQSINVDVAPAPQPTCEIKQSNTTSGLLLTPACTVPVGYIRSLTWIYKIDGQEQRTTSKSFLVTKDWIAKARISDLTLQIETDLGAVKTEGVVIN